MTLRPDPRPLYLLVIDKIKQDIESGKLKTGQRLPSEFELSKELGISRATLREALRILEDENVIIRKQGIGTFIKAKPLFISGIEELYSITQMIEKHGYHAGTIFVDITSNQATKEDQKGFQLSEKNGNIIRVERIRTADSEPVVYCIDKIPESLLKKNIDFRKYDSIFQALQEQAEIEIAYAVAEIEPLGYHEKISPLLHSPKETSLIILRQIHFDTADRPVLISVNYFRSDKFRFQVLRKR
ncbi:GntR family transcriptional regulator [Tepidibacillus fermentans]|uniref:GntR family transcriptional regulator n=1 Tax=Tepidibacillus fermentans TaxID=1281767 RepID=A0A4R3KIC9_9BACI|nr:GntR family transcriptional regulator [Tepidibacillus fermentans]TCS83006.1 GntR family transcriptional regulator [Tepidibacillus fermentans]